MPIDINQLHSRNADMQEALAKCVAVMEDGSDYCKDAGAYSLMDQLDTVSNQANALLVQYAKEDTDAALQ